MGYACPVCETPQSDAEHLANHLAFTAMLGDDDHEAWLDDHAPDWEDNGEDELADRIEEYAKEVGFPQVFDDTVDRRSASGRTSDDATRGHDHDEGHGGGSLEDELERANARGRGSTAGGTGGGGGAIDGEARQILQEAQQMTREMLDDESEADRSDESDANGTAGNEANESAKADDRDEGEKE